MKRTIVLINMFLTYLLVNAQIINVCGKDSIILELDNYVNGKIEWQESIDTINWVTIPETTGTTYQFFPTKSGYFRAVVKSSDCPPLYSAISFVQIPPVASAGPDRVVGDSIATLLGNYPPGTLGLWKIIAGTGGKLFEPTLPHSQFTGIYNVDYLLVWTVTNICGQSSDTVKVRFEKIIQKNNFIAVDSTDTIYSDSTEIANGIFRIKFSDPKVVPTDSVMLIGWRADYSFLRKVTSFVLQDSIYIFTTDQGSFQDLIKSGVLNMGDAINLAMIEKPTMLRSTKALLTRAVIEENKNNSGIKLLYVQNDNQFQKPSLRSTQSTEYQQAFTLTIDDFDVIGDATNAARFSIKDAYFKFTPNFVLDFEYKFPATLTNLRLGLENAEFEYNLVTLLVAEKACNWKGEKTLLSLSKHIYFMAGPVPVDAVAKFDIKASCDFYFGGAFKMEEVKNCKINITALVEGDNAKNLKLNFPYPTLISSNKENFLIQGKLDSEVKIGPEISFLAYGIVGPYLRLPAKLNMNVCANSNQNWEANASIGVEGYLGASADIVMKETVFNPKIALNLFKFEEALFSNAFTSTIRMPYKIELLSGNDQMGSSNEPLSKPISLRVISNKGFGLPLVPVRFDLETGDGMVNQRVKFTDSQGIVNTTWTLGSKAKNTLRVSVLDCENNDIEGSPLIVTANTTSESSSCSNSNFQILIKDNQTYKYPIATGSTGPYLYSVDGTTFSNLAPQYSVSKPGNYTVYAKDKSECIVQRSFLVYANNSCASSDLGLQVTIQANTLQLSGKQGTPPYKYSIDNQTDYTTNALFSKLTAGDHQVFVQDANGCLASSKIRIEDQTTSAINAITPSSGANFVATMNLLFSWYAGNYAINQLYDLYLKKGNEAFSPIAQNLQDPTFLYSGILTNGSTYTWKVVVKDQAGSVKDSREFSFNTATTNVTSPSVPTLIQPANGTGSIGLPITLSWNSQIGDFKYDLYLGENDANQLIGNNLSSNSYTINKLSVGKTYFWKVKIKNVITGENQTSDIWSFIPQGTVTDIDGNIYHTVTIDGQVWMKENLKTTKYNDGTPIPKVTDNASWTQVSSGAYCWYNNDEATYKNTYGALYNYYAHATNLLSPKGWHVATYDDWSNLKKFLNSTDAGGKLKETGTSHWNSPNTGATNLFDFTALPGGIRLESGGYVSPGTEGTFSSIGKNGTWWVGQYPASTPYVIQLKYNSSTLSIGSNYLFNNQGISIRCVKDYTLPTLTTKVISDIGATNAIGGGTVVSNGGTQLTSRGVCWNTSGNPTINDNKSSDGNGSGSFTSNLTHLIPNAIHYVRAYATNSVGTAYGNQVSFTPIYGPASVADIDGNTYHTIKIGTQTWMVENLKTTRYRNGDFIGTTIPATKDISSEATPKYQWAYNGIESNVGDYGRLYTSYAVNDSRNIAPEGWHLPSSSEWLKLWTFLGNDRYLFYGSFDYRIAKSLASNERWTITTVTDAIGNNLLQNNTTGYMGMPGGMRSRNGIFSESGFKCYLWNAETSTVNTGYGHCFVLRNDEYSVQLDYLLNSQSGASVRCIKD
jgi:uncharacterized protein (TIGR02145 family)